MYALRIAIFAQMLSSARHWETVTLIDPISASP
jgi:hypothetical protein